MIDGQTRCKLFWARRRKGYGYLKSMKIMEQPTMVLTDITSHLKGLTSTTSQGTTAQTNIGDDQSGNGNNFAVYNLARGDIVPDTPENNFPVMNNLVDGAVLNLFLLSQRVI